MTSKLDPQELERLSKAATQGVWRYRPDEHDDWGIVKSPVLSDGFACVLAQFRDPDALDNETLARHRETKTDPWEANARFVVTLVNAYRTGQLVPAMPSGDVVEAVARAICKADWNADRLDEWETAEQAFYLARATAAITAYEAVSGVAKMREALRPFADCCDQINDDEDDEEWAKFRLLIKDYRRARAALGEKP